MIPGLGRSEVVMKFTQFIANPMEMHPVLGSRQPRIIMLRIRSEANNSFYSSDICMHIIHWLVVLTILKNISQWEGLSHIFGK
jgi:hypothetical protein